MRLSTDQLRDILADRELNRAEKLLVCLGSLVKASPVKEIRSVATQHGLVAAKKWNVSQILAAAGDYAVRTDDGWILTTSGKSFVQTKTGITDTPSLPMQHEHALTSALKKISEPDVRAFVEEAVEAYRRSLFRSSIVLSWSGAVALLQAEVLNNHLARFNNEAQRRNSRWKPAVTRDDLGLMKEGDFLDVLQALSIIGKNVKQELKKCLGLRNGCGHPNSLRVGEAKAAAHLETLILNVFAVFT